MKLPFFIWKKDEETPGLVERITSTIERLANLSIEPDIWEVSTYGDNISVEGIGIAFGELAYRNVLDKPNLEVWLLPPQDKLLTDSGDTSSREAAYEVVQEIAYSLKNAERAEKISIHAETPEGATVGQENTNIQITPEELDFARKLKELLKGCKMVITKGDLEIKVE